MAGTLLPAAVDARRVWKHRCYPPRFQGARRSGTQANTPKGGAAASRLSTGPTGATGPTGPTGSETVYNSAGTLQTGSHIVRDTVAYTAGTATVTLTGSATFTNTNYVCSVTDLSNAGAPNSFQITRTSGSSFTINTKTNQSGTAAYICVGN
jgi:hypothetical protein